MLDQIESMIFSRIKAQFSERIKKKYPDLNFTTSNQSQTKPKFPTVYVHLMPSVEQGETLSGTDINAALVSFQIEVTDNQSQQRAGEVMWEVVRIMKTMRFSVTAMPEFANSNGTYRSVARFRRMIGAGDIL